jgi:hypothetical protein
MIANFTSMPLILKLLTAIGISMIAGVLATVNSGVNMFGREISASSWWGSGAGFVFLAAALLMGCSAILMLYRFRYSRLLHVGGWVAITFATVIDAYILEVRSSMLIPTIVFNIFLTAGIALYLYFSKNVRNYFSDITAPT